jgi:GT2 family glycosyltransferase
MLFGNFDKYGTCEINSPRGCNMAIRREQFLKIGGFNTDFKSNAWGFEADFGLRMARKGIYGKYIGDAIVVHYEISYGGSRTNKDIGFRDFVYNHKVLLRNIGPQAWIGSIPRLIKKRFF